MASGPKKAFQVDACVKVLGVNPFNFGLFWIPLVQESCYKRGSLRILRPALTIWIFYAVEIV